MRYLLIIVASILIVGCKSSTRKVSDESKSSAVYKKIEEVRFIGDSLKYVKDPDFHYEKFRLFKVDLNNDNIDDTILLESAKELINDPGEFCCVTISITNGNSLIIFNLNGWTTTERITEFMPEFNDKSLLNSKFVTVKKASNGNMLLFFKGYTYPSSPGFLTIVSVIDNQPVLIFNKDAIIYDYKDYNGDAIKDISIINGFKYYYKEGKDYVDVYLFDGGFKYSKESSIKYVSD